jgi:hypothetical protein
MSQTAILNRATLLMLFTTAVEDKVKAIDNDQLSVKVKKRLCADIIAKVNATLHSDNKPILLPNEFEIYYHQDAMCGGFSWERGDESGTISFMCGTKTFIRQMCMKWIRNPDNLYEIATAATLVKYLKEKPGFKQVLNYVKPDKSHPKFDAENCPICLEVWSDTIRKRRGVCGHLCCYSCINMVVASANPCCPVCRANYKTNQTFQTKWVQMTQLELENLRINDIGIALEENNGYTNRPALKRLCNLTLFQNEYLNTHTHQEVIERWLGGVMGTNLENGVETYFVNSW